jgi:peptide/nickel transport system substrate-binding protein
MSFDMLVAIAACTSNAVTNPTAAIGTTKRIAFVLACAILLSACTRITTQTESKHATGNPWTVHGLLRTGGTQTIDNLNPMLGTLGTDRDLGAFWCARLLIFDDHEALQPELALQEPTLANNGISNNGRTIVYHLRRGVSWQDGTPFTSADVAFSWQQVMNPNNLIPTRLNYDRVDRIDTPDASTAVVRLKEPYAPFISNFFTGFCIIPKHILQGYANINHADYNRLPIGTGAFRVAAYEPGVFVKFVANERYWRGAPRLREIDYHVVPSGVTLLTQFRSHEIDFYPRAAAEQTLQFNTIPGAVVYRHPFSAFYDLGFNMGNPGVSDKRVRQALIYAIDVPRIIHVATHDVNLRADSDQPPWRWSHASGLTHYEYNPRLAGELLDAAGWRAGPSGLRYKNVLPLRLVMAGASGNATQSAAQLIMQEEWRASGVDVIIKNVPTSILYALGTGVLQSGNFDIAFEATRETSDPDNHRLYGCDMTPPKGWNTYHYCSPVIEQAEAIALSSYDPSVRKAAYGRIQRALTTDLPFYVLWFDRDQDIANSDFRGYRPGTTASAFWNVWEWSI